MLVQGRHEASLAMQEALGAVAQAARRVDSTLSILKQVQVTAAPPYQIRLVPLQHALCCSMGTTQNGPPSDCGDGMCIVLGYCVSRLPTVVNLLHSGG